MLPESIDVSSFSPLLYIQRLHEAESQLRAKEKENSELIAENAMLKVEVENLKKLLPKKKTNPFAGSESSVVRKTNPFAGSESSVVRKTNPFAESESESSVVRKTNPFAQSASEAERAQSIVRRKTNPFATVAEISEAHETPDANETLDANETPETNETPMETPKPKLPPIHRRVRAHKPSAPKPAKQPAKPDEWTMSAATESSLLQQYASLCDGDNGVHVSTMQEEFENLGLDEATGNEM